MKLNLIDILSGWTNLALDKIKVLDEKTKAMAEERAILCNSCPVRQGKTCSTDLKGKAVKTFKYGKELRTKDIEYPGCGCRLDAKVLSPNTQCPLGKW